MKTSSFGGHLIYQNDSQLINTESNKIFESYSLEKKDEIKKKLSDIGIVEFEQVYSIHLTSSRENFKNYLAINKSEYENLIDYSIEVIGEEGLSNLKQSIVFNKGLGALKPEQQLLTESMSIDRVKKVEGNTDTVFQISLVKAKSLIELNLQSINQHPSGTCPWYNINPIKNQGNRGTCVAFSVTAANEYYHFKQKKGQYKLSEQHLYYETKLIDRNNDCGTTISNAVKVISLNGQCQEQFWPYRPTTDCNDHGTKPISADSNSISFKSPCLELNSRDIEIFKSAIVSGGLISFSIPVYDSWLSSNEVNRTGRITMPLPNENYLGGHAMTIVGYQDDNNFPGGGFFLIRNSWGQTWAKESLYGQGYGIIPYEYISKYCWEAFTLILA